MKKKVNLQRAAHWAPCGPLRFVILSRLSDDEQAVGPDTSLDAQERLCRAAIARYISENGGELVATIRGDQPGTNLKRRDWRKVAALAEDRKFDVLVSVRMDRVGRGATFSAAEYLLAEERIAIWVTEDRFEAGASGKVMKAAYLFRDGAYTAYISENVRSHQRDNVRQGWWPGGVYLYGMTTRPAPGMADVTLPNGSIRRAPRVAIAHPDQIGHVEQALRLVVKHRALAPAVEYLRREASETEWSAKNVRRVLTSPVFIGELHWGESVNEAAHAPLLDVDLWHKAKTILDAQEEKASQRQAGHIGRLTYEPRQITEEHLLRGMLRCAHCGSAMSCSWARGHGGRVNYYECAHNRAYKGDCSVRRVNARSLEDALLSEVFRTFQHPARMRRWMEAAGAKLSETQAEDIQEDIRLARRNVSEAKRKSTNLVAAIKAAAIAPDALPPLIEALAEQEKLQGRLEGRIAALSTSLRSKRRRISASAACRAWQDLPETWSFATTEEKRIILASLIESIDLTGKDLETGELQGTFGLIIEAPLNEENLPSCVSVGGRFEKSGLQCTRPSEPSNLVLSIPLSIGSYRRARKGADRAKPS
jgi:site-specific DNA recombinase